ALEAEKLFGRNRVASASEPQRPRSRKVIWSKQDGNAVAKRDSKREKGQRAPTCDTWTVGLPVLDPP
ncbi:MAG TPA: hypothetical protein VIV60_21880, partial [Polyangiaceae bacterium]